MEKEALIREVNGVREQNRQREVEMRGYVQRGVE